MSFQGGAHLSLRFQQVTSTYEAGVLGGTAGRGRACACDLPKMPAADSSADALGGKGPVPSEVLLLQIQPWIFM